MNQLLLECTQRPVEEWQSIELCHRLVAFGQSGKSYNGVLTEELDRGLACRVIILLCEADRPDLDRFYIGVANYCSRYLNPFYFGTPFRLAALLIERNIGLRSRPGHDLLQTSMSRHSGELLKLLVEMDLPVFEMDNEGDTMFDNLQQGRVSDACVDFLVWLFDYLAPSVHARLINAIGYPLMADNPPLMRIAAPMIHRFARIEDPFLFLDSDSDEEHQLLLLRALLDYGFNPNRRDYLGTHPLMMSCHPRCTQLLLERGANPAASDEYHENTISPHLSGTLLHRDVRTEDWVHSKLRGTVVGLLLPGCNLGSSGWLEDDLDSLFESDTHVNGLTREEWRQQLEVAREWQRARYLPRASIAWNTTMSSDAPREMLDLVCAFCAGGSNYCL